MLWREYWRQVGSPPWTVAFDADDPVMTPRGYDGNAAAVLPAAARIPALHRLMLSVLSARFA